MARSTSSGSGITGSADLEAALMQLAENANRLGAAAVRAGAKPIQAAIRADARDGPRAEGAPIKRRGHTEAHHKIKNSLVIKKGKSKGKDTITYLVGSGHAFHALFVERGTIHMAAQPFMQKGLASAQGSALQAMGDNLRKGVERTARRKGITL